MLCDYVKTRSHQIPLPPPTLPFRARTQYLKIILWLRRRFVGFL